VTTVPGPPCQVRRYDIWRAQGNFPTIKSVVQALNANPKLFTNIGNNVPPPTQCPTLMLPATTPCTTFTDNSQLQNNAYYTYFVKETNVDGATSRGSDPVPILVTCSTK
jgi:hypothetical protein